VYFLEEFYHQDIFSRQGQTEPCSLWTGIQWSVGRSRVPGVQICIALCPHVYGEELEYEARVEILGKDS
jgi:hypothetical protein